MNKCDHYMIAARYRYWRLDGLPIDKSVGICRGTKNMEECSCGGDRRKCDFYPEIREMAKNKISIDDAIAYYKHGIDCDIFSEPVTSYARMAVEALERMKEIEKKRYKIEIWQYHRVIETYESNEITDVLGWYRDKWYFTYDAGNCAFDVYEGDRQLSFDELYKLGFYGYSFNDDIGDI